MEREADNSPSSSMLVKSAWSYTPITSYDFMRWYLDKHRDN